MKIGGNLIKPNNVTLLQKNEGAMLFLLIIVNYLRKNSSDK